MRNKITIGLIGLLILLLIAMGSLRPSSYIKSPSISTPSTSSASPSLQDIRHAFIIVEENKPIGNIIGNSQAPYINGLIKQYSLVTNYNAVGHPSLPNYLALTSGSTQGITSDCNPPAAGCMLNAINIADQLEKAGKTWKAYAEDMPSPCYAQNSGGYATKHVPFLYYTDILNNSARCKNHVDPLPQLLTDLSSASQTPDFALITPNLCNDMHNCPVATGDSWLAKYVPLILGSKAFTEQPSLLFITWDEGDALSNHIATIIAGPSVKSGYRLNSSYTHYSLLHTMEAMWGLYPMTSNDSTASILNGFLKSQ